MSASILCKLTRKKFIELKLFFSLSIIIIHVYYYVSMLQHSFQAFTTHFMCFSFVARAYRLLYCHVMKVNVIARKWMKWNEKEEEWCQQRQQPEWNWNSNFEHCAIVYTHSHTIFRLKGNLIDCWYSIHVILPRNSQFDQTLTQTKNNKNQYQFEL